MGNGFHSGGGVSVVLKMDRKRVRLFEKAVLLETIGANAPTCSVFHGKGHNNPFPHHIVDTAGVTRLRDHALVRQRTWFSSPRGAHGNADAAHRPQDKRFTFGKRPARVCAPPIRAAAGTCRQRIGRGTPPPRASPHSPINHGYRTLSSADIPHPSFPDALMARHNAGGAGRLVRLRSRFRTLWPVLPLQRGVHADPDIHRIPYLTLGGQGNL